MRFFVLFLLSLFLHQEVSAQKRISARKLAKHQSKKANSKRKGTVILSLDTIFNKGRAYAIFTKKKMMPHHEYHVYTLKREELIFIQTVGSMADGREYYAFNFKTAGKMAYPEKYVTFEIEKEIVAFDLVRGDSLNPFGLIRFLKKYPPQKSSNTPQDPAAGIYNIIKRNREAKIYFENGDIFQDFELIGTYKLTDDITRVYLLNNITAAEIHKKDEDGLHSIHTLKDQKIKNLKFEKGNELRSLFIYLTDNGYL